VRKRGYDMTIVEKILALHSNKSSLRPGELVNAKVDLILGNDVTAPVAIKEFRKIGISKVFDKDKVALVPDHFTPNKDIQSAENSLMMRNFAKEMEITNYFEVGRVGIEHCLLPEKGLVAPGEIIIGADSHTCTYGALNAFATGVGSTDIAAAMATGYLWFRVPETIKIIYTGKLREWVSGKDLILYTIGQIGVDGALYKSIEFMGDTIKNLSIDSRMTMANMAIEAGAKCGLFDYDEKTEEYLKNRVTRNYVPVTSDSDAVYEKILKFDVSNLEPQVAFPHLPENTRAVQEAKNIKIDQAVIGSCTNGRMEDLRIAAKLLKGHKVHPDVRCIIFPGTQEIYKNALKEGLIEIFIDAGAAVSTPTCGPCLGGHMGVLAKGERAVSTTNRNFVGRMGHPESEVYLVNPAVATASAIVGYIVHPEEVLK